MAAGTAAVLGLGGAAFWGWSLVTQNDPDSSAGAADTSSETTGVAEPTPATPDPSSSESPPAEPTVVDCWDGSTASSLASCDTAPQGLKGMAWLYPSFDRDSCADISPATSGTGPAPRRVEIWQCVTRFNGGTGQIRYYTWSPGTESYRTAYYADKFRYGERRETRDGRGRLARVTWLNSGPNEHGMYELSSTYPGLPYSMSVYSPTYADLEQALAEMLEFRPPGELRGAVR